MLVEFHRAGRADLDTLLGLMRAYYVYDGHDYDETRARRALGYLLDNPGVGLAWLIRVADAVAGYAVICFGYSLEFGGRDAFLDELFVHEAYRRQGMGRQMIDHIRAVCRDNGVHALHLEVMRDNIRAREFYARCGFADRDGTLMSWVVGDQAAGRVNPAD